MKKAIKKFLIILVAILIIANVAILVTGKTYLYKGIVNTYLVGHSGPSIVESEIFYNRVVATATPQPWPVSSIYNTKNPDEKLIGELEKLRTVSFLVFQNDSVIYERYWDEFDTKTRSNSFSMAKSIISVLVGVAITEGKIKDVNQLVGDFIPSFKEGKKAKTTIKQLLTMSSGLDWSESGGNPLSDNAEAYYGSDLKSMVNDMNSIEEPGIYFKYLSGNTEVLTMVLQKATGMNVSEYASKKLWQPIGAENEALWNLDDENGIEKGFCCFYATARDFAKIGRLYYYGGNWNGKQLLSADYVSKSVIPNGLKEYNGNPCTRYGYSWWIVNYKGINAYYARGILGQYIIVIPSKHAIITRAGHERGIVNESGHPSDLYLILDAALEVLK